MAGQAAIEVRIPRTIVNYRGDMSGRNLEEIEEYEIIRNDLVPTLKCMLYVGSCGSYGNLRTE
jgi:hypothetical protein